MNYPLIIGIESFVCLLLTIIFFTYRYNVQKKLVKCRKINEQIEENEARLSSIKSEIAESTKKTSDLQQVIKLNEVSVKTSSEEKERATTKYQNLLKQFDESKAEYEKINNETLELQKLNTKADQLEHELRSSTDQLDAVKTEILNLKEEREKVIEKTQELMSRVDLYSRLEEFVSYGHFEEPTYLYETSERFAEEIKRVRQKQKQNIKDKTAVTYPTAISITSDPKIDQKILDGQVNLMLTSFNIDCDHIIGKVKPSTFARTLEQIEKLATKLEKLAASLHCGFNTKYVKLKYEECTLQYQYTLKKQEEQEEQRLIKERMREEVKAQKEYDNALAKSEKEERLYRKMLEKAKQSLENATDDDRIIAQQRIEDLKQQLAEAVAKSERVKSLAEQTRRGHVYIISNVGAFGKGVCKIGLTRRLDPLDRVKELGDASVPFRFDIHAIILADDAPSLEASLHRKFKNHRVNAVNFRKEFFHADLSDVKKAVEEITGKEVDFKMTALADEYYESRRLQSETIIQ